jgi:hypothetical protein
MMAVELLYHFTVNRVEGPHESCAAMQPIKTTAFSYSRDNFLSVVGGV